MKKLNKRGKIAAAFILGGGLLLSSGYIGADERPTTSTKTAAPVVSEKKIFFYPDEYTFELFRVNLISYSKGEVFAEAIEKGKEGGLYLDNNRNLYKYGDIIKAVFDSSSGELIATEKVDMVRAEDGSMVPASFYGGSKDE